jgi:hypothetical protein
VRTRDAAGVESSKQFYSFIVRSIMPPEVTSAEYPEFLVSGGPGVPGTFTFQSHQTGATEFVYSFNGAEQTVPIGADGTASITWTPTTEWFVDLQVRSRRPDGTSSEVRSYFFFVNQEIPEG